jgi:hypothetical protein
MLAHSLSIPDPAYETFIAEAVDDGLSLLGNSGKKAIYYYLEKDYDINKRNVSSKIQDFSNALDRTFGVGSAFLKVLIIRKVYEKISAPVPETSDASRFVELLSNLPSRRIDTTLRS